MIIAFGDGDGDPLGKVMKCDSTHTDVGDATLSSLGQPNAPWDSAMPMSLQLHRATLLNAPHAQG